MPFIAREEIKPEIRERFEGRYKTQLREALHNPGLTAEAREHLRRQAKAVGQAKIYSADSPPKAGAVSFPKYPSSKEVRAMRKPELVLLAQQAGVDSSGAKPELLKRVLAIVGR